MTIFYSLVFPLRQSGLALGKNKTCTSGFIVCAYSSHKTINSK